MTLTFKDREQRFEYVKKLSSLSPYTLYSWYIGLDNIPFSKHYTLKDIPLKKLWENKVYRSTILTDDSDELRLDFDYNTQEENLNAVRKVIEKLLNLGVEKFETYFSGGKGIHLTLRYEITPFSNLLTQFSRQDLRQAFFESLKVNVKVDTGLFRTSQMIGCEGYNHRKTDRPKQRIKIDFCDYEVLDDPLNFDYLKDEFVNALDEKHTETIKDILQHKREPKKPNAENVTPINLTEKGSYDKHKLFWAVNRFNQIFSELQDGKKRAYDSLARYLISTTKDYDFTYNTLEIFKDKFKIECASIPQRIEASKNQYEMWGCVFPYKDILTKEQFYKGYEAVK